MLHNCANICTIGILGGTVVQVVAAYEPLHCTVEWVTCKNFGFLSCFRQGWVHVTLRNKKNIGLICFMFISSSYFWLLCRTKTAWWSKNEKMFQIGQNQSKKYVRSDVVTQKIQYKGVLTVYLLILKMFQTDFCCTMNICPIFLPQWAASTT